MTAARRTNDAGRARSLAAALAFLVAGVAFYADHMSAAPRFANPGGAQPPALAVMEEAALPPGTESLAHAPQEARTAIAWTRPWGNQS
jgi:hypothetical protein